MTTSTRSFVLLALLAAAGRTFGQWGPMVRLSSTDSASQISWGAPLLANGQYVHAVWNDFYAGTHCLAYARSSDAGVNWATPVPLSHCLTTDFSVIYGSGANMHLAYDSTGHVLYRRSSDNGASWSSSETLTTSWTEEGFGLTAAGTGYVFLLWYDWQVDSLYFRRSTNSGSSWSATRSLCELHDWSPSDAIVMDSLHNAYLVLASSDSIVVRKSTDYGATWGNPVPAVITAGLGNFSLVPDIGNRLHLSWTDSHTGQNEVYYIRSTDQGTTWGGITRFTISNGTSLCWIGAMDDAVYVSYHNSTTLGTRRRSFDGGATWNAEDSWPGDFPPGSQYAPVALGPRGRIHFASSGYIYPQGPAIVYYRSLDCGNTWVDSNVPVSFVDNLSRNPAAVALGGGDVHILWQDYEYGNYDMFYRRGIGLAGLEEVEQVRASEPALAISANPSLFRHSTALSYTLTGDVEVFASIRDIGGRLVWSAPIGIQKAGRHVLRWNGENAVGEPVSAGCYFCVLQAGGRTSSSKLLVTR